MSPTGTRSVAAETPLRRARNAQRSQRSRKCRWPRSSASKLLSIVGAISLGGGCGELHRPTPEAPAGNLAVCGREGDEQAAVVVERGEEVADHTLDLAAASPQLQLLVEAAAPPFDRALDRVP